MCQNRIGVRDTYAYSPWQLSPVGGEFLDQNWDNMVVENCLPDLVTVVMVECYHIITNYDIQIASRVHSTHTEPETITSVWYACWYITSGFHYVPVHDVDYVSAEKLMISFTELFPLADIQTIFCLFSELATHCLL